MILSYRENGKTILKINIIKFWQGITHTKFEFKNGQILELPHLEQFYIGEEITKDKAK